MTDGLKQFIEEKTKETKRHFDVVAENLEKNIVGAMKEELQLHGQQITALQKQTGRVETKLEKMDYRLAAIETTLESKSPTKSKGLPFLKPNYENP